MFRRMREETSWCSVIPALLVGGVCEEILSSSVFKGYKQVHKNKRTEAPLRKSSRRGSSFQSLLF